MFKSGVTPAEDSECLLSDHQCLKHTNVYSEHQKVSSKTERSLSMKLLTTGNQFGPVMNNNTVINSVNNTTYIGN